MKKFLVAVVMAMLVGPAIADEGCSGAACGARTDFDVIDDFYRLKARMAADRFVSWPPGPQGEAMQACTHNCNVSHLQDVDFCNSRYRKLEASDRTFIMFENCLSVQNTRRDECIWTGMSSCVAAAARPDGAG